MNKQIQGIDISYDEIKKEITAYIESRINDWNNYVAADDSEFITLIGVELHGSRLRNQARDDSDLDCVFEYSGNAREDDVFNFFNYDEDEGKYMIDDIIVDFNPIKADKTGSLKSYMKKSAAYDAEQMDIAESINILQNNGYIVEGIKSALGKAAAIGALAAGTAFGNSGIDSKPVKDPALNFGKNTTVHLQNRYNLQSDRYGVPKTYKLDNNKSPYTMSVKSEIELTKKKILATPDSMLKKYGKQHVDEIANLMVKTANKYNIDIDILLAIAGTESNYDTGAVSDKKAKGMMQITKVAAFDSHTRLQGKDKNTFNMDDYVGLKANIDNAGRIIADLSVRRNNVIEMIFASYNGGTKQATAWRYYKLGKDKLPDGKKAPELATETKNYVDKCITLYNIYKKVQNQSS